MPEVGGLWGSDGTLSCLPFFIIGMGERALSPPRLSWLESANCWFIWGQGDCYFSRESFRIVYLFDWFWLTRDCWMRFTLSWSSLRSFIRYSGSKLFSMFSISSRISFWSLFNGIPFLLIAIANGFSGDFLSSFSFNGEVTPAL